MPRDEDAKGPWVIHDWAGNHKFPDKEFDRFGDACAFLDEQFPADEDRGEFWVVTRDGHPCRE